MQDADKQRPYYGRALVLFAHVSRKTTRTCLPGWGGWMHVDTRPRSASRPSGRMRVDVREKRFHAPKARS